MATRQEAKHGRAAVPQLPEDATNSVVLGVDHLCASEKAQPLDLESECEVEPRDVEVEVGIEELLFERGLAQVEAFAITALVER